MVLESPIVTVENVMLAYPIYSVAAQSLRSTVLNLAVGGKIMRDGRQIVHVQALKDLSFRLFEGDRLGIVGHNGSGKTSLLKLLARIYEPNHGFIEIKGKVSSMLDISHGIDLDATGYENIQNIGRMQGLKSAEIAQKVPEIVEFSELGSFLHFPMKTYSAGMGMRLLFTLATSFERDVLLLDEWLGAGDAHFVHKASQRMDQVVGAARVVVLASHSEGLIRSVCNKVMKLHNGEIEFFGSADDYFAMADAG